MYNAHTQTHTPSSKASLRPISCNSFLHRHKRAHTHTHTVTPEAVHSPFAILGPEWNPSFTMCIIQTKKPKSFWLRERERTPLSAAVYANAPSSVIHADTHTHTLWHTDRQSRMAEPSTWLMRLWAHGDSKRLPSLRSPDAGIQRGKPLLFPYLPHLLSTLKKWSG